MARAILYPSRTSARARRARQALAGERRRRRWPWALLVPLPVLLLPLGTVLGGSLRAHMLPAPHAPAIAAAAPALAAGPAVRPSAPPSDPVQEAALAAVSARLGAGGVPGAVQVTHGDLAAYARVAVTGAAGVDACYAYLHQQGAGWDSDGVACGRGTGFAPAVNATVAVRAPGTCARLRGAAGADAPVLACVPDGAPVLFTGPPVYRDGHTWWPATWERLAGDIALDAFGIAG